MHAQRALHAVRRVITDAIQQISFGNNLLRIFHQKLKYGKLRLCQPDRLSFRLNDMGRNIQQNIPILSYFANKLNQPIIAYGGPLIAFLAITTSFFGHYFGAREGAYGIVRKCCKLAGNENPNLKLIAISCGVVMYAIMLIVAYLDPSVLGFIESLGGPIIAAILFLMPIIAIWNVSKLKKFRNPALDAFVLITGILTIITVIYQF